MTEFVDGDLFAGNEHLILHGCNCFCKMGASFALEIARRFPEAVRADAEMIPGDNKEKLGTYTAWIDSLGSVVKSTHFGVLNFYTQAWLRQRQTTPRLRGIGDGAV